MVGHTTGMVEKGETHDFSRILVFETTGDGEEI